MIKAPLAGCFLTISEDDVLDMLKNAAIAYEKLTGKEFCITLSNGRIVRIVFKIGNFSHLAGLHKLTDLYQISSNKFGAVALFKLARSGKLTFDDLNCSYYFDASAKERLESLCRISELLIVGGKAISDFDKSKCKARVQFKADTLFFKNDGYDFFITFGVAKDKDGIYHYPETVFYRFDRTYITGQNIVSICSIEIKSISNKKMA